MVKRYKKKPVEIEAIQFTGDNYKEVEEFVGQPLYISYGMVAIPTLEGIMRKTLMERLRKELKIPVQGTYGYITKCLREKNGIPKSHTNDARCISKNPLAIPCDTCYYTKAVRHHNRQLHKATILKGGIRKANQAPYIVKGYRLWDKVFCNGTECFITGRRTSGYFALKKLDGTVVSNSISYKKLRLLEAATNYITERK